MNKFEENLIGHSGVIIGLLLIVSLLYIEDSNFIVGLLLVLYFALLLFLRLR